MGEHRRFLRELEESDRGHFVLENRNGRATLIVYPSSKRSTAVTPDDVFARLELFGLSDYDPDEIIGIVFDADGKPHDICEYIEPDPVDGTVSVELPPDKMTAYILLERGRHGGKNPDAGEIHAALERAGVIHGIDEKAIRRAADVIGQKPSGNRNDETSRIEEPDFQFSGGRLKAIAARGNPAVDGENGSIHYLFEVNPGYAPEKMTDSDRVDFKSLKVVQTCGIDQLLAEIRDPVPGQSGSTVTGDELPEPEIVHAVLEAGSGAELSEDGRSIRATRAGQIKAEIASSGNHARIYVEELLNLDNVDYSTGHVNFPGAVSIRGTVLDGFRVEASGDIIVEKSVGNVMLYAGGEIVLFGGIVSRGGGFIQAGGDIYVRFSESASISSGGNIFVEEAVMHSRLTAGKNIIVDSGRGEVMGGVAVCGKLLRAKKIGARVGTPTFINVGLDPDTLQQLRDLESEYEDRRATLKKVETHLSQLKESERRGREPTEEDLETREKLLNIREKLKGILENLESQRERIYSTVKPDPEAMVEAMEILYPGVEISFGAGVRRYALKRQPIHRYSRFIMDGDAVVLRHSDL